MHPPCYFPPPQTPSGRGGAKAPVRAPGPIELPAPVTRFLPRHPRWELRGTGPPASPLPGAHAIFQLVSAEGSLMSSSLGGGGGGRDYGHIRFALTTITRIFLASSGRGEIYTAGRRRGRVPGSAFLSRGRMSPKRRKESWTSCVYRVGWEGMEIAGEQPAKQGSGGSMLAPTLSRSLAHPSISF